MDTVGEEEENATGIQWGEVRDAADETALPQPRFIQTKVCGGRKNSGLDPTAYSQKTVQMKCIPALGVGV